MAAMTTFAIAVLVVLALVALFVIGAYNGLVTKRNRFENAYAQIDVQLKRRYDLIPNLVETVKGYMQHERETLEKVILARNEAHAAAQAAAKAPGDPGAMKALAGAEGALATGLGRILALAESYPDLKASQNMRDLSEELTSTENKIAFARQGYNDAVTEYNNTRESFPAVVIAGALGFTEASLLEVIEAAEERRAPKVSFG
jgi:LemA protein